MKKSASLFVVAAFLMPLQFASATPFSNGDFETGTADGSQQGSPGSIPDWKVGPVGFTEFNADGQNGQNAQSGDQFISFGHSGNTGEALSQTFDTDIGQTYSVTYYVSRIQGGISDQSMSAMALDGTTMATLGLVATNIPDSMHNNDWVLGTTLTFTALSNSTTLEFLDTTIGGGDSNWALDTVIVTEGAPTVPDSGTTASLLAISLIGIGILRRKPVAC